MALRGMIFDKDGTLFDFGATWNAYTAELIADLSGANAALAQTLAEAVDFDLTAGGFRPTSPMIAGTNLEAAALLVPHLPGRTAADLEQVMSARAAQAPLAPAVPLRPLMQHLQGMDLCLGVMTNDSEASARAHLASADILDQFAYIAGFDSGFGAKPAPTPLLAFADQQGIAPDQIAMVGDSTHDLIAGRAAGMVTIAVLTGMADHATLAPHADVVLPHIGHIPAWLAAA